MPDLVFIHGAGDSAAVWGHQVSSFSAQQRHRALAFDLPGHGDRFREPGLDDHELNAQEVSRLMDERGLQAGVIIGHSMGGAVALTLTLQQPHRVQALVLVAAGAKMRMHPSLIEEAKKRAEALGSSVPSATHIVSVEQMVSGATAPEALSWLREHVGKASAQATYADFTANDRFDVMNRLGEIKTPTLVIGGSDDRMTPAKFSQYLADHISNARLAMIPHTGHYPMVEQVDVFNTHLANFLNSLG